MSLLTLVWAMKDKKPASAPQNVAAPPAPPTPPPEPPPPTPRRLFTDCWNSYWHVILGVFAVKIQVLVPLFIFYQFIDQKEVNVFVDVIEFLWGYIAGLLFAALL